MSNYTTQDKVKLTLDKILPFFEMMRKVGYIVGYLYSRNMHDVYQPVASYPKEACFLLNNVCKFQTCLKKAHEKMFILIQTKCFAV